MSLRYPKQKSRSDYHGGGWYLVATCCSASMQRVLVAPKSEARSRRDGLWCNKSTRNPQACARNARTSHILVLWGWCRSPAAVLGPQEQEQSNCPRSSRGRATGVLDERQSKASTSRKRTGGSGSGWWWQNQPGERTAPLPPSYGHSWSLGAC
jgi:hypothetical protein